MMGQQQMMGNQPMNQMMHPQQPHSMMNMGMPQNQPPPQYMNQQVRVLCVIHLLFMHGYINTKLKVKVEKNNFFVCEKQFFKKLIF